MGRTRFTGREIHSEDGEVKYRIQNGLIQEIWTRRANYRFFFGRYLESWLGSRIALALLRISFVGHLVHKWIHRVLAQEN